MRGYLAGSGWKEYQQSGTVCGIQLPAGLTESSRLAGADLHPVDQGRRRATTRTSRSSGWWRSSGRELAEELRRRSLRIFQRGSEYARQRGIIIADTKFEFGRVGGRAAADRRGAHARQFPLLAGRPIRAGPRPAVVRQAVRARLAVGDRLGQEQPAAAVARRRGGQDPAEVRRGLRAADRSGVRVAACMVQPRIGCAAMSGTAESGCATWWSIRMIDFPKRVLFLGYGAVAQCALPIFLKHFRVPLENITVMDFEDRCGRAEALDRPGRPLRPAADHAGESRRGTGQVSVGGRSADRSGLEHRLLRDPPVVPRSRRALSSTRRSRSGIRTPARPTSIPPSGRSIGGT